MTPSEELGEELVNTVEALAPALLTCCHASVLSAPRTARGAPSDTHWVVDTRVVRP